MLTCPTCGRANPAEASFCMGCGGLLGATATAHETRRTVTALFCDLVGSTTLGERHDPEVLRSALECYFDLVRTVVERHGGRVEKYVGDAVNGVFGLPTAHEDDALRAVRAGVEIQAGLADVASTSPVPLAARVGIHTGEVLAPGSGRPLIGDAMNTAARLQSGAEPGSVVIGEPTFRLVRDAVVAEPLAPLELKGKAAPVGAYLVRGVASTSPMRARRLDAPMVGRARESALLAAAFERSASDRTCELFTVLGSAGAGKSRLVEEFLTGLAGSGAEVLRGRCLAYGEGITWYPVAEALRGALGLPVFADADAIRAAIRDAVVGEEHAAALEANLAPLFAVGPGGTAEETAWAIRRFLEATARDRPVVLVLDDIHWGEPAFLDLVEHLADWSRDAAILLLCMARPDLLDVRPAWGGGKTNATTISLAPLTGAETDALIDGLLGSSALPAAVRDRITRVAEGNPLFVEEMLRMLVDDGRLVRDDGGWAVAGDLVDLAVPPTVSALLSARLDRLSDGERAVVEAASVEGKEFHRGSVAALLPEAARADLSVHLRSLVRKELVTPERSTLPGEDAYRFRHLLIRDTAYDAIPKRTRAELHCAFADWLEHVAGDRIAEQQELLGYHLERAHRYRQELGLPDDPDLRLRAATALGRAGATAIDRGDLRAAIDLLRLAADLAGDDRAAMQIVDDLYFALQWAGQPDEAQSLIARQVDLAAAFADVTFTMRARLNLAGLGAALDPGGADPEALRTLFTEARDVFHEHGASAFEAIALNWLVNVAFFQGDAATAVRHAAESLQLASELRDRRLVGWAVRNLMAGLEFGPAPLTVALDQADAFVARFVGDRWVTGLELTDRGLINAWLGRADAARADVTAARDVQTQMGIGSVAADISTIHGLVAWSEGNLDAAARHLRDAASAMDITGERFNLGVVSAPLARVLLDLDLEEEAAVAADVVGRIRAFVPEHADFLAIRSVLAARRGDTVEGLRLAREAHALSSQTDFAMLQCDVALDCAEVLLLAGRPDEARASATDALEKSERKEYAIGIRRAKTFLASFHG